ncbi:MAG: hypothetical protein AAFY58_04430 [Planctomycetota bacterium]
MSGGTLLPAWGVMPFAIVMLLLLAGHIRAIATGDGPASRVRIRTANGYVMMLVTSLLACALSIVPVRDARTFVLVWMVVIGLVAMMIVLGMADAMNNVRLAKRLRGDVDARVAEAIRAAREAEAHGERAR